MAHNQLDPLMTLSASGQGLMSTRYQLQQVVSYVQTDFLRGMKAMRNAKRRFCEGWRGPCTTSNRRTARRVGFYVICVEQHSFWDVHPQHRRTGKKKSAGDPMSLVVNYKEECCITSVSRAMYAALQAARRHLPPNRWRWQLLCLPTARGSACKKDWNMDVGSYLVALVFWISTRKHKRVRVNHIETQNCSLTEFLQRWALFNKIQTPKKKNQPKTKQRRKRKEKKKQETPAFSLFIQPTGIEMSLAFYSGLFCSLILHRKPG